MQLDEAIKALTNDLRYASTTIQADLDRFQRQKVGDIREMCLDFSRFHKEWAMKVSSPAVCEEFPSPNLLTIGVDAQNLAMWEEAKAAIDAIADD
jgi:hypothetical protein